MSHNSKLKSSQSTMNLCYFEDKGNGNSLNRNTAKNKYPRYGFAQSDLLQENLDSLNSIYIDSLNQYQNLSLNIQSINPYDIPENMNNRYFNVESQYCTANPSNVVKNQTRNVPAKPKLSCTLTVDFGETKSIQSKVIDRSFNPKHTNKNTSSKPTQRNFLLNLNSGEKKSEPSSRSILKNYKSCPVSPVSEECKWSDVAYNAKKRKSYEQSSTDIKKTNSLIVFIELDNKLDLKSIIAEIKQKYGNSDDVNSDLDLRPSKEIVDIDNDANFSSDSLEDCSLSQDLSCKNKLYPKRICKKHSKANNMPKRSVSDYEIYDPKNQSNIMFTHPNHIIAQKSSTLPRNLPFTLDDTVQEDNNMNSNYTNMYRCQSVLTNRCITTSNESVLSDNSNSSVSDEIFIKYDNEGGFQQAKLSNNYSNDSQNNSVENVSEYFEKHRPSSASFFLNQRRYMEKSCSRESILSHEMFDDNPLSRTNCNSLESILSDDSDYTKSAPLEMLFEGTKPKRQKGYNKPMSMKRTTKSCYELENTSKSYGSSPNNPSTFGTYMYKNYFCKYFSSYNKDAYNTVLCPKYTESTVHCQSTNVNQPQNKYYGFQVPSNSANCNTITKLNSLYDSSTKQTGRPPAKSIAYYFDGDSVQQYVNDKTKTDQIPRLDTSNYMANYSKSLSPECLQKDKHKSTIEGCDSITLVKSKSCSFEVVLEPAHKQTSPKNVLESRSSHVQKRFEIFEEQIRKNDQQRGLQKQVQNQKPINKTTNVTKSLDRGASQKNVHSKITMDFVLHKPPKPKKISSVKLNKSKINHVQKSNLTTPISSNYKAKLDGLQITKLGTNKRKDNLDMGIFKDSDGEKSFDVIVKEKDIYENCSDIAMDSLEVAQINNHVQDVEQCFSSIKYHNFTKDSLDFLNEPFGSSNPLRNFTCIQEKFRKICDKNQIYNYGNYETKYSVELEKYSVIKRKLEIVNKLVKMEERKIMQEKLLKERRMKPLRANFNESKGVVKVPSKKFEKLATKHTSRLMSVTLEENDAYSKNDLKDIKRNRSLPDILDSAQIYGFLLDLEKNDTDNLSPKNVSDENTPIKESNIPIFVNIDQHNGTTSKLNNTVKVETQNRRLEKRVYNEMIMSKTDVHLDSENYESSTISSNCADSPEKIEMYTLKGYNAAPTIGMRVLTPRLSSSNRVMQPNIIEPSFTSCSSVVRSDLNCQLSRRAFINTPNLPSKYMPTSGWNNSM